MLVVLVIVLDIVLIIMFIHMYLNVNELCRRQERIEALLRGIAGADVEASEVGDSYEGYVVPDEVRRRAKEYWDAGVESKAETVLRSATDMPHDIARDYLKRL